MAWSIPNWSRPWFTKLSCVLKCCIQRLTGILICTSNSRQNSLVKEPVYSNLRGRTLTMLKNNWQRRGKWSKLAHKRLSTCTSNCSRTPNHWSLGWTPQRSTWLKRTSPNKPGNLWAAIKERRKMVKKAGNPINKNSSEWMSEKASKPTIPNMSAHMNRIF